MLIQTKTLNQIFGKIWITAFILIRNIHLIQTKNLVTSHFELSGSDLYKDLYLVDPVGFWRNSPAYSNLERKLRR